jgi:hypothetical protein
MKKTFISFSLIFALMSNGTNAAGAEFTQFVITTLKSGAKFETVYCDKIGDQMSFRPYKYGDGTVKFPIQGIFDVREVVAIGYIEQEEKPIAESKQTEESILNPLQLATNIAEGSANRNTDVMNGNSLAITPIHLSPMYKWFFGIKKITRHNGEEWVHVDGTLEPKNNKNKILPLSFKYYDSTDSVVAEKTIMPKEMKIDEYNKNIYTISDRLRVSKSPARVEISVIRQSNL